VIYVGITGIGWKMLPPCFPSYKTVQHRLDRWLELDAFNRVWASCVRQYDSLRGINLDQLSIDGSRKPAKKGGSKPVRIQPIEASAEHKSC
jgi:transposase